MIIKVLTCVVSTKYNLVKKKSLIFLKTRDYFQLKNKQDKIKLGQRISVDFSLHPENEGYGTVSNLLN